MNQRRVRPKTRVAWVRTPVLCSLLILVCLFSAETSRAQEESQEVFLSFTYGGVVDDMVEARYDGEQFYVSLTSVFEHLQIDHSYDSERGTVSGFFLTEDRTYSIDLAQGRAEIAGDPVSFSPSSLLRTELDVFLRPHVFQEIFGLEFTVNNRALTLELATSATMPVVSDARRDQLRGRQQGRIFPFQQPDLPLRYDREFHVLSGGALEYSVGATYSGQSRTARFTTRGGAQVLGGDVRGSVSGRFSSQGFTFRPGDYRWRYAVDTPYLSQVQLGRLSSSGLRRFGYRGVRLTNDPLRIRRMYGTYHVDGEAPAGWDVELLMNDQLIEQREVGEQGRYSFEIPLTYGSTEVTLREYGPSGQMNEESRRIDVPFTFVPEGEVYYSVDLGQSRSPLTRFGQARASVGLTNWLTNTSGYDFLLDPPDQEDPMWRAWNEISARLFDNYVLSLRAAPNVLYRGSLTAVYPSQSSFDLSYAYREPSEVYNRSGERAVLQASGSYPVDVGWLTSFFRFRASRRTLSADRADYRLAPSMTVGIAGGPRLSFAYDGSLTETTTDLYAAQSQLEGNLTYGIPSLSGVLSPLGRFRLSLEGEYGLRDEELEEVSLDLSRNLGNFGRLRVSGGRNFLTGTNQFQFRLNVELPSMRATTTFDRERSRTRFSQDVSGAIGYDRGFQRLVPSDRGWVGRAAVSMHMFVDENGNDTFDEGEETIEEGSVNFRRPQSMRRSSSGVLFTTGLHSYERYNVTVARSSISNPLWIPRDEEFSFVAEPNVFKKVEIPFYVAGVIEGQIARLRNGRREAVPGLDVIVRGTDRDYRKKIDVFNQGDFYDYQIPPGEYVVHVDSTQLAKLNVRSEPRSREFSIAHTAEGDYVGGLEFTLHPVDDRPPAVAEEAQPAEDVPEEEARSPEESPGEETAPPEEAVAERPPPPEEAVAQETAAEEEASGMSYAVQVGAFSTYRRAEEFARHSEILFDRTLRIRYKPDPEVFAVEMDSFGTRREAAEVLESYESRPYLSGAFVEERPASEPSLQFAVQVGAFFSRENAELRASRVRRAIGRDTPVALVAEMRDGDELYKVVVNPSLDREYVESLRDRLRTHAGLEGVFVTSVPERELEALEPQNGQ